MTPHIYILYWYPQWITLLCTLPQLRDALLAELQGVYEADDSLPPQVSNRAVNHAFDLIACTVW